jgi:hypothetical protein
MVPHADEIERRLVDEVLVTGDTARVDVSYQA